MSTALDAETLADLNKLDAVVHALGIEDSFDEPAEAVAKMLGELGRLRAALTAIAHTEYGDDGARRYPEASELRKWAKDALNKSE